MRKGDDDSLLIFLRVSSKDHLHAQLYRSRIRDWMHGVRAETPATDIERSLADYPMTEAERLRIIHHLITHSPDEGGAGITPGRGEWTSIEAVFPLQDHAYNKAWIKKWSTQSFLTSDDLDEMRNRFGEKVAFYFAFTQTYFTFLTVPAAIGVLAWLLFGHFSPVYAVAAGVWTIVFVEWWKHREHDLAARWGVLRVSNIDSRREAFQPQYHDTDPVTGETVPVFPARERLQRQLLQIPYALAALIGLGSLIALCFSIEIFISEVYSGPGKSVLVFVPTVILTTGMPALTGVLTTAATRLNQYENYETESQYERSLTVKTFVLQFITSYLPIALTAFVYIPFGSLIVPYLDVFRLTVAPGAHPDDKFSTPPPGQFSINPDRLRKQVIYFTVTAQLVNFAVEIVLPHLKRGGLRKVQEMRTDKSKASPPASASDPADETEFLTRVRCEVRLSPYDSTEDIREMVVQFGYLALFSVVWPLVPLSFLLNNWLELRADAVKICTDRRRPLPTRADTIGPWLDALAFLSWAGSVTMPAIAYMFSGFGAPPSHPHGHPDTLHLGRLLLAVFISEHLFLALRWLVASAVAMLDSPGRQHARRAAFAIRQKYISSLEPPPTPAAAGESEGAEISRAELEEEARQGTLRAPSATEQFWRRQRGWRESFLVGRGLMEEAAKRGPATTGEEKEGKKEL